MEKWWLDPELNWGHKDFQSSALPTELSSHTKKTVTARVLIIHKSRRFPGGNLGDFPFRPVP